MVLSDRFFQGVSVFTSLIAIALIIYIKMLKNKMKRYILRSDKIEKYFERDSKNG